MFFFHFSTIFIQQLVERHGAEAERQLFRCLFSWIDFDGDGKSTGKDYYQVICYLNTCFVAFLAQWKYTKLKLW